MRVSRSVEDYLETIYSLSEEKGHARVLEIAKALGVRPPSVTQMLKKMRKLGLVSYERYGRVTLTSLGEELAKKIRKRHIRLKLFLIALGLPEPLAEEDACAMEHVLHEETVLAFGKLADFIMGAPEGLRCIKCLRTGKYLCLVDEENR